MKILVLGAGGREHALVWRLARDRDVREVCAAPGNPGIAALARCLPVDLGSPQAALDLAVREGVDLTVVGPEAPLEAGIADLFRQAGRAIVGPGARGAALECSKAFAKEFMASHGIPTARFAICESAGQAREQLATGALGYPVVVKADGLAAGKGVIIADDRAAAEHAIRAVMDDRQFGRAGDRVVLEECLSGPEVSYFVLCDGDRGVLLGTAQDHKRIFDDDRGPNTGGMGAFAPSPLVDRALVDVVQQHIVEPVLRGMAEIGEPYRGFLYVSLMLTSAGPRVIEFNVRMGDPETQVVMPLVEGSFARALYESATARSTSGLTTAADRCVGVVLASRGYPASAESGQPITGIDRAAATGALVFHAGTRTSGDEIVTAGGRVLTVVARAPGFEDAMLAAYRAVDLIRFDGMQYRTDIGRKALAAGRV